jgi:hypothetical protein
MEAYYSYLKIILPVSWVCILLLAYRVAIYFKSTWSIWSSHICKYGEYYLVGYDAV